MTGIARRWLPRSALSSPLAVERIAECLAEWSKAWLAVGRLTYPPGWRAATGGEGDVAGWTTECGDANGFSLHSLPGAHCLLASGLLGRPVQGRDMKPARDKFIVSHVVRAALDDLAKRIGVLAGAGASPRAASRPAMPEARYLLPVSLDQGEEILIIGVEETTLVELAREAAGAVPARPIPEGRRRALASQTIGVSALVGRNRLGLKDVESLGVGDVLKLETSPQGLLDITVNGKVRGREAASLLLGENAFELQIRKQASEW